MSSRSASPRNNFTLAANASHSILLAGGIGVTPIASMAGHLRNIGASYAIHYFARSAKDAALLARLERDHGERLHPHYLDPAEVAALLREIIPTYQAGLHVYLCGPTAFMNLAQKTMRAGRLTLCISSISSTSYRAMAWRPAPSP